MYESPYHVSNQCKIAVAIAICQVAIFSILFLESWKTSNINFLVRAKTVYSSVKLRLCVFPQSFGRISPELTYLQTTSKASLKM